MEYEKITIKREILDIEAGDLIKWELGREKIFAIVTRTKKDGIWAISIYDNRNISQTNINEPHTLYFGVIDRIDLILKSEYMDENFDRIKNNLFKEVF